ncbi:unnamed protein product [Closterium sp. NIES-54]
MAARTSPHGARRCEERKCRDQHPQTSHAQRTTHEAAGPTGSHGNAAAAGAGYHQSLHPAWLHLDQHHRRRHLHHRCRCLHRHGPVRRHRQPAGSTARGPVHGRGLGPTRPGGEFAVEPLWEGTRRCEERRAAAPRRRECRAAQEWEGGEAETWEDQKPGSRSACCVGEAGSKQAGGSRQQVAGAA